MSFPENIKFKYSWRKYQQRVLDDLQRHLQDNHLHVVAPPGSGKTVLGLEVALRLNKPTLILAPTLAIRNQWVQRFCELFLQTDTIPDWISNDIRNPKFLTVCTYQGLHAACSNLNEIINKLNEQKIKTLVLDEAHHLKNEWWQTLTKIKEKISPVVVGLTATPPYDVTPTEWQRYIELNGVVDAEISVPELVVECDLCPHQDYVYFTFPTMEESQGLEHFRQNKEKAFLEIKNNKALIEIVESHPVWQNPNENLDWIYNNLAYYSACLIFLNHNEKEIPKTHIKIIDNKKTKIPALDYQWLETLLTFYLYKNDNHFKQFETHQTELENKLKRYGILEKRQIHFTGDIEILIGTKSLLGEGWDAPTINSLILASFVGSFVLSNQMRGRAIRTCKNETKKTSNIWHIVCLDPTNATYNGEDFDRIKRRFRGFVGISTDENPQIENGLARLHLPENILENNISEQNNMTFSIARNRESLQKNWEIALKKGVSLVEEIKVPFPEEKDYQTVKSMYLRKTIANLLLTLGSTVTAYFGGAFQGICRMVREIRTVQDLYPILSFIVLGFIVFFGQQTFKTLKLYFKYRDIAKDFQHIGDALLNSLKKAGVINSDISKLFVRAVSDENGCIYCHLEGGTTFEQSVFIKSLHEIIGEVENPRYLIIRQNRFLILWEQNDYHSVPELLGKNKKTAEYFARQWQSLVGNCELAFTRTIEGRKLILKARVKALASQFEDKTEQLNKWV